LKIKKINKIRPATFVCEFELNPDSKNASILAIRLRICSYIYNACLGEALKRRERMIHSPTYIQAIDTKDKPQRKPLFRLAAEQSGFGEYGLHDYTKTFKGTWLGVVDAAIRQKIATRAFNAVKEYHYGQRGKPRFKNKFRVFGSAEGKSNNTGIRLARNKVIWNDFEAPILIKEKDPVQLHALLSPVKYVRLLFRIIRGKKRWFAQVLCEGKGFQKPKNKIKQGTVGIDIGPSAIAYTADDHFADHVPFCDELLPIQKKKSRLQSKINRSLRKNNPGNYESDRIVKKGGVNPVRRKGKNKKGCHQWIISKTTRRDKLVLCELERKHAAKRKELHGQLINKILSHGNIIKAEKLSYKAFQKMYGRSVGFRAPGLFMNILRRKAENAGGRMDEFPTYETKLSQRCHCGRIRKKSLSERWHVCECGILVGRDLYSAFLAMHVKNNVFDAESASMSWLGFEQLLQAASEQNKSVIGGFIPASFSQTKSRNGLLQNNSKTSNKVLLHAERVAATLEPHTL
jgi:putative transposase